MWRTILWLAIDLSVLVLAPGCTTSEMWKAALDAEDRSSYSLQSARLENRRLEFRLDKGEWYGVLIDGIAGVNSTLIATRLRAGPRSAQPKEIATFLDPEGWGIEPWNRTPGPERIPTLYWHPASHGRWIHACLRRPGRDPVYLGAAIPRAWSCLEVVVVVGATVATPFTATLDVASVFSLVWWFLVLRGRG